jgi:PIN domain nuclease of toxin-antitoxin system
VNTILLDTHALQWWSAEPDRLSPKAVTAIEACDELAVAAITWFELAWLATHGRITLDLPARSWLVQLSADVRTLGITPAIAETAVGLPATFPGDPADRLIYATAIELGCRLVTKDSRLRKHRHPRPIAIW